MSLSRLFLGVSSAPTVRIAVTMIALVLLALALLSFSTLLASAAPAAEPLFAGVRWDLIAP